MSTLTCSELVDVAPELALRALPGKQRAEALAHLDRCADCRAHVEQLSDAADALLLLAPEAEPPIGFAPRVASGFAPRRPSRRGAFARLAAVAAVTLAVVAGSVGAINGRHTSPAPTFALRGPGVRVAHFVSAADEHVQGDVFSYAQRPSWVFMTVRDEGSDDAYRCQIEVADGHWIDVGSFQLHDGVGSWGKTVNDDIHQLTNVRLVDDHGAVAATASFS
jgi:predicted anti-sigma-YlaC factor YlaD